jgi:hypothetical protein
LCVYDGFFRDWYVSQWTEWGRSNLIVGVVCLIRWGPGYKKTISSLSWNWDTFIFSYAWIIELQTSGLWTWGLTWRALGFSGLWPQTESYTISFPNSEAFVLRQCHATSIPWSLVCILPIMRLFCLHNCISQIL